VVGAGKNSKACATKKASSIGLSWLQVFIGDVQEMPRDKPPGSFAAAMIWPTGLSISNLSMRISSF
jgi:hypothetical protein